jgi:hypothetical protein
MKGLHVWVFIVEAKQRCDRGMQAKSIDECQRLSSGNQRQNIKARIGLVIPLLGLTLEMEQIAMLGGTEGKLPLCHNFDMTAACDGSNGDRQFFRRL